MKLYPRIYSRKLMNVCLILALSGILIACDSLVSGFKAGLAASKPFVQSLVDSGSISSGEASNVTQDLTDGVSSLDRADLCLNQIKNLSGGAKRTAKAKCYFTAAQDLRGILARRNFDVHEQLTRYSTIVSGAIEAFESYYASVTTGVEVTGPDGGITHTGADGISGENADKELERSLKEQKKELDALIKGK